MAAALTLPQANDVRRFEDTFAHLMGQRDAIAFPYGRTGLALLLEALGLRDREIIVPAYTCVVVPHAVVFSGNQPVFVDSRPHDFNMDLAAAERLVRDRTGALVATSIFGYPVDLDELEALSRRHPEVIVIQDCAHSFAAEWHGRPVHRAGVAALFGLNISKLLTSIFGGMVTTDDPILARRLRGLRDRRLAPSTWAKSMRRLLYLAAVYPAFTEAGYALVRAIERTGVLDTLVRYYDDDVIDMPADYLQAMSALESRVGRAQLARYPEIVARRRAAADAWRERLARESGVELPPHVPGATYSHFVCLVDDREGWIKRWRQKGVELGQIIEYCVPELPAYRDGKRTSFPCASGYARRAINFPVWLEPDRIRALG